MSISLCLGRLKSFFATSTPSTSKSAWLVQESDDKRTAEKVLMNLFSVSFRDKHDCKLQEYLGESLVSVLESLA